MKEDADAAAVLTEQMQRDGFNAHLKLFYVILGVSILTNATVTSVRLLNYDSTTTSLYHAPWPLYEITISTHSSTTATVVTLQCEAILNATGRKPNVDGLHLEKVYARLNSVFLIMG